ncbi:MAG: hypothetical protein PHG91_08330 [Syntrophales bacterium]|nr:hypothetical protein [Syntrophales bacterium]MDD5233390.1 hypothetical protein [Syntrophales bacterium]MDD5533128.1 hypothetical protein [Syntrophales bacterium]HPL64249.1 hypothetical protein [Syntrophales bacterium]
MALDESQEDDQIFTDQGITFAVEKELLERTKPIRIDFVEAEGRSGFTIQSSLPACGTCC